MNKKQILRFALMVFAAIVMTAGFASCGGDGDDGETAGETNKTGEQGSYSKMIVGKWIGNDEVEKDDMMAFHFFSNGTGKGYEYDETTGRLHDMWDIEWSIRGEKLFITELASGEDDADMYTYNIVSITANHALLFEQETDGREYYYKFSRVSAFPWE